MQECSCPNKAVLCRELYQADISDPVPTFGAASWHCRCEGTSLTASLLAWASHQPWGTAARGGSGPGCSTALQGSCSALPPRHCGLQKKQRQHPAISAASTCEASGPEGQSLALHPVECSQDKPRGSTAMENYYPPVAVLQGCCLDCSIHNYTLRQVGSLQINCLAWKGEKLLPVLMWYIQNFFPLCSLNILTFSYNSTWFPVYY